MRQRVVESKKSDTERKQAEDKVRKSEDRYRALFEQSRDPIYITTRDRKVVDVNQSMLDIFGYTREEMIGMDILKVYAYPSDRKKFQQEIEQRGFATNYEVEFRKKDGAEFYGLLTSTIRQDDDKNILGYQGIIHDITERKYAEEKIKKLYSLQIAITNINQALLRSKTEAELFQRICDSLIEVEFIRFAWIGVVENKSFEVKPIAYAGFEDGFLSCVKITWDDSEYGVGPTGMAIKTRQPYVIRDTGSDPRYISWREETLKRGYMSSMALPLLHETEVIGALNVYSVRKDAFRNEEVKFLAEVAEDIAIGLKSLRLQIQLKQSLDNVQIALNETVGAIAALCEMRDPYTSGHERRVSQLACAIAREIGLPKERIEGIHIIAFIHDIGKIVVPAEILSKPGTLNDYEFSIIKTHPQAAYNILKKLQFPWPVAQTILQHHERLNGSGYPRGLSGEDIILEARILGLADTVEAMASHRPYRPALGIDKALEEISKNKGILYDSSLVDICLRLFREKGFEFE